MFGKNLEISPLETFFLLVLHKKPKLSGAEIAQEISHELGDEWVPTPGAIYKVLQSLEKKGIIREITQEEPPTDQRIRLYALTTFGDQLIPKVSRRVKKIALFLNTCCPECCDDCVIIPPEDLRMEPQETPVKQKESARKPKETDSRFESTR